GIAPPRPHEKRPRPARRFRARRPLSARGKDPGSETPAQIPVQGQARSRPFLQGIMKLRLLLPPLFLLASCGAPQGPPQDAGGGMPPTQVTLAVVEQRKL